MSRVIHRWVCYEIVAAINVVILLPPILVQVADCQEKIAKYMYIVLGVICHQRADRSFYLFGDHFLYPKAEVWKHVPFDEMFTFDFRNRFTCGEGVGCKLGVCARCTWHVSWIAYWTIDFRIFVTVQNTENNSNFVLDPVNAGWNDTNNCVYYSSRTGFL